MAAAGADSYYDGSPLVDRLRAAIRAAGLDPSFRLSPDVLGPLDHFHTGGFASTVALLDMVPIDPAARVLDVGAGLAGPARVIADRTGCAVTCVDLDPEICAGARVLNDITGLADAVEIRQGDALDLPFPAEAFDLVWMQNVSMNIRDKPRLYREARRVLRAGGRIAFQEIVAGGAGGPLAFPVTWADGPAANHCVSAAELRRILAVAGFEPESWVDATSWALELPRRTPDTALGYHVYVRDAAAKMRNNRDNMEDGRTLMIWSVARGRSPAQPLGLRHSLLQTRPKLTGRR